jgi:hypothetical protein
MESPMAMDLLRDRARVLMWLVTVPFALLALLAAMQLWFVLWNAAPAWPLLIAFVPMYIYIWAMWMVRQALKAIAAGRMFDEVVPRLLLRVGIALFVGALFNVFGTLAAGLIFQLHLPMTFDGAAITLGVIGATLVLVSQLLKQAAAMREELDGFF